MNKLTLFALTLSFNVMMAQRDLPSYQYIREHHPRATLRMSKPDKYPDPSNTPLGTTDGYWALGAGLIAAVALRLYKTRASG